MTYRKVLGDWGEDHACCLLANAKFTGIVPLNVGRQHPGGDVMTTKDGRVYFFSVKARDRFGQDRKPNPGYSIYPAKVVKAAASYGRCPIGRATAALSSGIGSFRQPTGVMMAHWRPDSTLRLPSLIPAHWRLIQ